MKLYSVWINLETDINPIQTIVFQMPNGLTQEQQEIYAQGILFCHDFCPGDSWGFGCEEEDFVDTLSLDRGD